MIETKHSTREYAIKTAMRFKTGLPLSSRAAIKIDAHHKRIIVIYNYRPMRTRKRAFRWSV